MRTCSNCGTTEGFSAHSKGRCHSCHLAIRRERERDQNSAHKRECYQDPEFRKRLLDQQHKSKYGITHKKRDEILAAQGGGCAICGITEPPGKGWCTDHNHECCPGQRSCGECVRGVLCCNCNCAIGQFKESSERMLAAIAYIEEYAHERTK